jgi:hypothetical protein
MRLRVAEIGEHAVAHILRNKAARALDQLGAAMVISTDDLAHVLGVEPRGKRSRANQIAEHHRQLPPLGARLLLSNGWRCRGGWDSSA